MKKAIILIIFFFIYKFGAMFLVTVLYTVYGLVSGDIDIEQIDLIDFPTTWVTFTLLLANALMLLHLWLKKYIPMDRQSWSSGGWRVMLWIPVLLFCISWIEAGLQEILTLPDYMAGQWELLSKDVWGIFAIVILGPVVEELLFRGAITKLLLQHYKPWVAILVSSLIFGIIHLNPAQIFFASLWGALLGWLYYRTRSVLPSIVLHILNNGLALWFIWNMPDSKDLSTFGAMGVSVTNGAILALGSVALLVLAIRQLRRATIGASKYTTEKSFL